VSYNPWGKKNPFLSMWLSGANAMLGATMNQARATQARHANHALRQGTEQVLAFWGLQAPKKADRRRRRR